MSAEDATMQIRSFRVCFQFERRIHSLDRWRLPLPYGMPVRGLLYGAAILVAVLVVQRLPLISTLAGGVHPIILYGFVPVAGGFLLTELKLDGRAGHAVALAWLRMQLEPSRISAFRPAPDAAQVRLGPVTVAADGRGPRLRRAVLEGEGPVLVRGQVGMRVRGRTLHVRPEHGDAQDRGRRINLRSGQRMVIG